MLLSIFRRKTFHPSIFKRAILKKPSFVPPKILERKAQEEEEKIQQEILNNKELDELMRRDPLWIAFEKEKDKMESDIWFKKNLKHRAINESLVNDALSDIKKQRKILEEKYKLLGLLQNAPDDSKEHKAAVQELAKVILDEDNFKDVDFQALVDYVEKNGGVNIRGGQITEKEIEEFIEVMKSPMGKQITEKMDKIFTDERMKQLGLSDFDDDEKEIPKYKIENFRHLMKKELENSKEIDEETIKREFGVNSVDEWLDQIEEVLYSKK